MKPRILFVDDEPEILEGLQAMLYSMRSEWELSFVGSGAYVKLSCGLSRSSEFPRQSFTLEPMVALAERRRTEAADTGGDRWVGPQWGGTLQASL